MSNLDHAKDRCAATKRGWFCNRTRSPESPLCSQNYALHAWWPRWWNWSRKARAFRRKRHL